MDSLSDVFRLCRLCLVQERVNIPIFDDPDNVRQIPLKISSCLPVQVSREDNLPKKICDECSNKLDLCYDFWTSTANAEKTLLSTVEKQKQAPELAAFQLFKTEPEDVAIPEEETQSQISEPPVPEPILIKAESEESEAPSAKRPRQSAAIIAQMHMAPESDDDEVTADQDFDGAEDEVEEEIDDPDVPEMSVDIDEVKPGTSGLNLEIADSKNNWLLKKMDSEATGATYKCLTCMESFDDLHEVKCHQHQETCKYFCERCSQQLDTQVAIVFHVIEHNMDDEQKAEYECEECFSEFYSWSDYENHQTSCPRKNVVSHPSPDPICVTDIQHSKHQMSAEQNLQTTIREVYHSDTVPKKMEIYCNHCNKAFKLQSAFDDHLTKNSEGLLYGCNECGKFFVDKCSLGRHSDIHTGRKPYKCDKCEKSFKQISHLNTHIKTHTVNKPFKCKDCGKGFSRNGNLKTHIMIHSNGKPFECKYCDKSFTSIPMLDNHIKKIHTGKNPFKCKDCDQCFAQSSHLRKHIRIHAAEKPYKCTYCDKCFSQSINLKRHISMIHTSKKSFKCLDCGECFAERSYLKNHIKTHLGENTSE